MATPKATVLCILLYLSVQSHSLGQVFPYISFMGTNLANHSYVNLSLVGNATDGSDNVQCHSDLNTCCSGAQGADRGDWYFPTGQRLNFSSTPNEIYEQRGARVVDLRRRNNESIPGIYRCDIKTKTRDLSGRGTVFVGLYNGGG